MFSRFSHGSKRAVLLRAALLTAVIALIDWRVDLNISFGFLYMFPMLLAGAVLSRWQIVLGAVLCSFLSDVFDPFPFYLTASLPQDILVFTALAGTGLFSYELTRSRRLEGEHRKRLEAEMAARREAEEQLEFLINSSPAAILTTNPAGDILLANAAAHRMFGSEPGSLPGRSIAKYIAALGRVPSLEVTKQTFRTEMECRGKRENGEGFIANVFFSTYRTAAGPRLAALIVDGSDDLREREEFNLEQLMAGSRILVGAVSHEIRNVCGAISVIYENLLRSEVLKGSQDFEALGALVNTLHKIASLELKQSRRDGAEGGIDLQEVLSDLRIVLEPYCEDSGITVKWTSEPGLPLVWADRHSLLQVLLNLTKNSERALENGEHKTIEIAAMAMKDHVTLTFTDSGPGLASTDKLFQPFQKGADSTGLGLYLSRAFLRSFGGDLRHVPTARGCAFAIDLALAETFDHRRDPIGHANDTALVSR